MNGNLLPFDGNLLPPYFFPSYMREVRKVSLKITLFKIIYKNIKKGQQRKQPTKGEMCGE
jgi:hypothetical protein